VWRPRATSSMENACLQKEENFPTHNKNEPKYILLQPTNIASFSRL